MTVRWGIGARLGVAFAAVAGLAVAANLLAEREISVIRTTRLVPVAAPAQAAPAPAQSAPAPVPVPVPVPVPAWRVVHPDPLSAAIDHFEGAIRSRLDVHNEESDQQVGDALRELTRATQVYVSEARGIVAAGQLQTLQAALAAYRSRGDELVRTAGTREDILKEFRDRFEILDARMKASLAQAWKIFGRVVARKSLIDLNSNLDDIRRRFAALPTTGDYDRGALDAVVDVEAAFAHTVQKNAVDLARSQGADWVTQMRDDMAGIGAVQNSLIQIDTERRAAVADFAQESQHLVSLARATSATSPTRATGVTTAPVTRQPRSAHSSHNAPTPVAIPLTTDPEVVAPGSVGDPKIRVPTSATPPSEQTLESVSTSARRDGHAALLGWISAAVLLLMLCVSAWTVISIVGPVRRMRSATRRLAGGEVGVQVARGGIQELDELAISFNQMAVQLADAQTVARTYQEQLEAKVDLRTRELQHLAEHDPLTQLPNRRQLFIHLKAAIARAETNHAYVGVFFLDLDNFKNINDSMGHAFGDRVLESVAERLRATAGPGGFAARLGGDEFTVVCDCASSVEAVRAMGWDLVRAFQQPVAIDGRELMVSVSVGASIYPDHENNADALLRAADAALFRAKALGRSQLSVFSPELLEAASAKFSTEQGLRRAVERGEFELVFQPEINAATLTPVLVEGLLRWRLPDGRRASPGEFLAIAEESGLIMDISDWVLRTSIETAARWHHGAWPETRVAINLSSRQLIDSRFVDHLMDLLREHRLPARCIEIELTENVLQTGAATIEVLHQLRAQGVAIALDDFGTGYSSFASLEHLPLTRVKLDRTLIASIHTNARSAAIARAIVGLCHRLGLEVTAEGIECPEQLAMLADLPSIYLQGYLLARPVSADKLMDVMAELPHHMQSLLLTSPVTSHTAREVSREDRTVTNLRILA